MPIGVTDRKIERETKRATERESDSESQRGSRRRGQREAGVVANQSHRQEERRGTVTVRVKKVVGAGSERGRGSCQSESETGR